MPVEIREITIKTEIDTSNAEQQHVISEAEIKQLKEQLENECEKVVAENTKRSKTTR